jgi:AcrR family transcriptional regulator
MADATPERPALRRGRPRTLTPERISSVAIQMFIENGFDETTVDDVATRLGVTRRTVFRYFRSKNDMLWFGYEANLERFRKELEKAPADGTLMDIIAEATVAANSSRFREPHFKAMITLIMTVPALVANRTLQFAHWQEIVAEFAAERLSVDKSDLLAQTVAQVAFGAMIASVANWVENEGTDLEELMRRAFSVIVLGPESVFAAGVAG